MNPSAASKGTSFAGAVGYITHDVGKSSTERVDFTEVLNMRTNDPEKAAKVMAWTAFHAAQLKEAAGLKTTGRKTENPVYHFSLNWEPGEKVSHQDMVDAAKSALTALGYQNHEAVLAVHRDKPHQHIHVVVNRIHPETGKTHNPNNDYEALQRWAYQYEKDRGRVVCLDRAIKYETDKSLKAEYTKRLAVELESGKTRESKPRPQWEAEKDATHPKSKAYQELKSNMAARVRDLAKAGRDAATRRAQEWEALNTRHAAEKAALLAKQSSAFKNRRSFDQAVGVAPYSWKDYQADRSALKKKHAASAQTMRAQLKALDAPAVNRFKEAQKGAWRAFYRLERAEDRGQLDKALKVVTATPVGKQGPEYRDHLARLFNAKVEAGTRKVEFGQVLDTQKKAFYGGLTQKNAPVLAILAEGQAAELIAIRQRFEQSRVAQKSKAATVTTARDTAKQERADLAKRHRSERAATKAKHAEDTADIQKSWAALNADRAKAWDSYRRNESSSPPAEKAKHWSKLANAMTEGRVPPSRSGDRSSMSAETQSKPRKGPDR
jgi:hypothetical protein